MFHIGFARHVLDTLVAYVRSAQGEVPLSDDPVIRDRIASLHGEVEAAERLAKRAIWMQENGQDNMVFAAMAKVYATELLQRLALAATDIAGMDGTLYRPLFGPASSSSRRRRTLRLGVPRAGTRDDRRRDQRDQANPHRAGRAGSPEASPGGVMDLSPTQRQRELRDGLTAFLTSHATSQWEAVVSSVPGYDARLWSELLVGGLGDGRLPRSARRSGRWGRRPRARGGDTGRRSRSHPAPRGDRAVRAGAPRRGRGGRPAADVAQWCVHLHVLQLGGVRGAGRAAPAVLATESTTGGDSTGWPASCRTGATPMSSWS